MNDRTQFITDLKGRALLLFPDQRTRLNAFLKTAEEATPEKTQKLADLKKASLTDPARLRDYNRIRTLAVENLIIASSNAATFFNKVTLADDEEPMLENTTGMEAKARLIGEDGKPHMTQVIKSLVRQLIPLSWVSTDELEYVLVDIYKGRVGQDILNAVPLARDLGFKLDKMLWQLVTALPVATFKLTGRPESRTFVLHSNIVSTNVPTGNLLDFSAETAFNFNVVKGIVKWFMQMANIFPGGPTTPQVIFVPSIDVTAFIDALTLTASGLNPAVNQIFTGGYVTNIGGMDIAIVGDATLDPAAGLAYVRTSKPIGEWYTKPGLDVNYPENTSQIPSDWIRENKGRTFMKKVFGAVTPLPWTINMLAVKYK